MSDKPQAHHRLHLDEFAPLMLAFVSGLVDVVCYLGLFQTFVAFVTGTLIFLGEQLVVQDGQPLMKLVVIIGFIFATLVWAHLILRLDHWRPLVPVLLAVEAALLATFFVLHKVAGPLQSETDVTTILLAVIGASAMALQNALMVVALNHHVPTTFMTGNLVRFLVRLAAYPASVRVQQKKRAAEISALPAHYQVIICFFAGILVGAFGFRQIGLDMILLPAVTLFLFSVLELVLRIRHS